MSSFTREDAEVRSEEVEELCCFDRMKKLIAKREVPDHVVEKDQMSSAIIEQKISRM